MAEPQTAAFADLLKRFRVVAGLSQEELAERAGLSVRGISDLERGISLVPRKETITLLSEALALSPEERALLFAARRHRPLPSPAAGSHAVGSTASPPARHGASSNLPTPLTPILGREREEAAAVHLLRRDDVRLLTLTGAPGIGKTRLALQVGAHLRDDPSRQTFPDGVVLVELAPIADPALVLPEIARALTVPEGASTPDAPHAALSARLGTQRVLLILDNFEQVVAAAPHVSKLLQACPGLKVLATSRTPLHVQGEQRLAIPPLTVPDPAALSPDEDLTRYPAVALFLERAQLLKPTFTLSPESARAVAVICAQLDGLPLAIELAAAWTRLLSPVALLSRLSQRLPLLTAGTRDMPARQQTLRGAIGWSYELLTAEEQTLFRRLAVFVGGCTLEAVEAVCDEGRKEGNGGTVLSDVATLVDTSLIDLQEGSGSAEDRLRLLELVREYAHEQLERGGELEAMRERHARYFLGLAREASLGLDGPADQVWTARLARESENLRAAFEWARRHDIAAGLRAAAGISSYWVTAQVSMGRQVLDDLLELDARAGGTAPTEVRAQALNTAGLLAYRQDDFALAQARVTEALALGRGIHQRRVTARALSMLGNIARTRSEAERARALYDEVLALRQEIQRQLEAALVAHQAGQLTPEALDALWHEVGTLDAIEDLGGPERALTSLIAHGTRDITAQLGILAQIDIDTRAYARAGETLDRVIAAYAETNRPLGKAWAEVRRADVAFHQAEYARAEALLRGAIAVFEEGRSQEGLCLARERLGRVATAQGKPADAVVQHRASLALCQEMGDRATSALNLEGLAAAVAALEQSETAVRLLAKAAGIRAEIQRPPAPSQGDLIEATTAALRAALGADEFKRAWAAAADEPIEHVLAPVAPVAGTRTPPRSAPTDEAR